MSTKVAKTGSDTIITKEDIGFDLKVTWLAIARMFSPLAQDHGVTVTMGFVLLNISREHGTPATKIAPLLGMEPRSLTRLIKKEMGVALVNGIVWGGLLGVLSWVLYGSGKLGAVMTAAMTLNLLLAAFVGVMAPMIRNRLGQDPAVGSSVIITAVTDSGGFFIFLGLATIFLM